MMTNAKRLSPAANLVLAAVVFPALVPIGSPASADQLVYSHEFVNGVIYCPGDPQYDDWLSYRASIPTSGVMSITISGSQDPVGRTCSDPATAQQIADAMRTRTTLTVDCGGFTWEVAGECLEDGCSERDNDLVLSAGGCTCCSCGSTYILRPGVGNENWGGIVTTSCLAETQTITVEITDVAPPPPGGTECADPGTIVLSQSNSLDIIPGSSACNFQDGTTAENSFARAFNNIGQDMNIVCVRWAIETVNFADETVTMNIYEDTNGGAPNNANLVLLGSQSTLLPENGGGVIYVVDFGMGGIPVTKGMNIVVELDYPDTSGISGVWPGSNALGQSGPSYFKSASCGIPDYVDLASVGVPNMHLITEIRGNAPGAPCPWDLDGPQGVPDGEVGVPDLLVLLGAWGPCDKPCPPTCPADFDGPQGVPDCEVGVPDLLTLLGVWGPCP